MSPDDDDRPLIEAQLGRPLRAASTVVARCRLGLPVVVQVPPVLEGGVPFPTRRWLSCPLAHKRIARLEAAGGVRAWEARIAAEPALKEALEAAHARYAAEREAAVPEDAPHRPRGGIAGIVGGGVKCLHAHYADHAAGGPNPVGAGVAEEIEPLDCEAPCVRRTAEGAERDPGWREP